MSLLTAYPEFLENITKNDYQTKKDLLQKYIKDIKNYEDKKFILHHYSQKQQQQSHSSADKKIKYLIK